MKAHDRPAVEPSQNDQQDKTQNVEEMPVPQQQRPRRRSWLIVLLALLLLALAGGGYAWKHHHKPAPTPAKKTQTAQKQQTATTCGAGLSAYQNRQLGFGFCYPTSWGTPTAADAKLAPADTGSRWLISFSAKPAVHIGAVSSDWTTQVGRDGTCSDPTNIAPDTTGWSTIWTTQGSGTDVSIASRDVDKHDGVYVIREYTDSVLTSGVCLQGITIINAPLFAQTTASYYAAFAGSVMTPDQHVANDTVLIPASERQAFTAFVQSVHRL